MILRRALSCVVLTAAFLTVAQATAAQDETRKASSPARNSAKATAKATQPNCAVEQQTCVPLAPVPKVAPLNSARAKAEDPKTQWIFQGPPENTLPFQNDLSPVKKKPVGGLVGLEFPF